MGMYFENIKIRVYDKIIVIALTVIISMVGIYLYNASIIIFWKPKGIIIPVEKIYILFILKCDKTLQTEKITYVPIIPEIINNIGTEP